MQSRQPARSLAKPLRLQSLCTQSKYGQAGAAVDVRGTHSGRVTVAPPGNCCRVDRPATDGDDQRHGGSGGRGGIGRDSVNMSRSVPATGQLSLASLRGRKIEYQLWLVTVTVTVTRVFALRTPSTDRPHGWESWTRGKNEEIRLDAFEMKGLRKILRVSWTAKKTNEWVLNKARVKRELLDTVKARKLAYYGHTKGVAWRKR